LTFFAISDRIWPAYSEEAEEYVESFLQREPLAGEKRRGAAAEYTVELAPER